MTYKYLYIRRELYEESPSDILDKNRNLSDMKRLFKRPFWIMLGALLFAFLGSLIIIILTFIGLLTPPLTFLYLVPIVIIITVSIISEVKKERFFYNETSRANELSKNMQNYEQYISKIRDIFLRFGIDTPEKVNKLKTECETKFKTRDEKFAKINSKTVDMLIGVPLGALIASIIYTNSKVAPAAIGAIILIGIVALGFVKLIGLIEYFSEGCFKDKYLLDSINELDYFGN